MAKGMINFAVRNELKPEDTWTVPGGPSMTRQEFAEECDINTIMERYDAYLSDPMASLREPVYYDWVAHPRTLMDAMDIMKQGEEAFMRLPAKVRREFDNNAAAFVDFATNPANLEQMREWELAKPAPVAEAPAPGAVPPGAAGEPKGSSAAPPPKTKPAQPAE